MPFDKDGYSYTGPKRKEPRGSYDRTGVWISAAEKRENARNRRKSGGFF